MTPKFRLENSALPGMARDPPPIAGHPHRRVGWGPTPQRGAPPRKSRLGIHPLSRGTPTEERAGDPPPVAGHPHGRVGLGQVPGVCNSEPLFPALPPRCSPPLLGAHPAPLSKPSFRTLPFHTLPRTGTLKYSCVSTLSFFSSRLKG